jgi:hypothetical protein
MTPKVGVPLWRDSQFICALADSERHLGHILKEDHWIAFDATHVSEKGSGIRQLGIFSELVLAKEAVERAVAARKEATPPRVSTAGISVQ